MNQQLLNFIPGMAKKVMILVGGSDLFSGLRGISKGARTIGDELRAVFDEIVTVNYNYFFDRGYTLKSLNALVREKYASDCLFFYGYSKGGEVVLKLSRLLQDFGRIELLLTVDIANGPWSSGIDRKVPANVRRNINVYQTTASAPLFSFGCPAHTDAAGSVIIENINLTGMRIDGHKINHSNIERLTVSRCIRWLRIAASALE